MLTQTPAEPRRSQSRSIRERRFPDWHGLLYGPFLWSVLACFVLAAISAAVLPTVPSYDPWAWISWGREVTDPHLSFAITGGPSWKPLPVMFTTIWALFGSAAAPTLWVITARAGGFLGMVAAYLLASRLVSRDGRGPRWAAVAAGLIAAAGIVITQDWWDEMFRGTSEPMEIATALWAVLAFLDRRPGWAFALGVATSLLRPEAWPLVIVYAGWLWWKQPRLRVLVVLGLISIPFFWFAPPWIGSGQPFLAAIHAEEYNGGLGKHPLVGVLGRGIDIQLLPVLLAGFVAVAFAWFDKPRDWLLLSLAGATVVWWVIVVGMTLDGYPGLERFYLPAAGMTCVLAGVGIVRLAMLGANVVTKDRGAVAARRRAHRGARRDHGAVGRRADQRGQRRGEDRLAGGHPSQPDDRRRRRRRRPRRRVPVQVELRGGQPQRPDRAGVEAARDARPRRDLDAPPGRDVRRPARLDRRDRATDRPPAHPEAADRDGRGLEGVPDDGSELELRLRRALTEDADVADA